MKEPYRSLYSWLVVPGTQPKNAWRYDVYWAGSAFYIGTNDEHITVLEDVEGFHHSFNENGHHVTRSTHSTGTTFKLIEQHIEANPRAYFEPRVLRAVKYIAQNMMQTI